MFLVGLSVPLCVDVAIQSHAIPLWRNTPKTPEQNAIPRSLQRPVRYDRAFLAISGYSSDSLRYPKKHSATGALLHPSHDSGFNLAWDTKCGGLKFPLSHASWWRTL